MRPPSRCCSFHSPNQSKLKTAKLSLIPFSLLSFRAELGRATWKLLHTMASRYPEKPKPDERAAMKQWIMLLSRLYPCGEW